MVIRSFCEKKRRNCIISDKIIGNSVKSFAKPSLWPFGLVKIPSSGKW